MNDKSQFYLHAKGCVRLSRHQTQRSKSKVWDYLMCIEIKSKEKRQALSLLDPKAFRMLCEMDYVFCCKLCYDDPRVSLHDCLKRVSRSKACNGWRHLKGFHKINYKTCTSCGQSEERADDRSRSSKEPQQVAPHPSPSPDPKKNGKFRDMEDGTQQSANDGSIKDGGAPAQYAPSSQQDWTEESDDRKPATATGKRTGTPPYGEDEPMPMQPPPQKSRRIGYDNNVLEAVATTKKIKENDDSQDKAATQEELDHLLAVQVQAQMEESEWSAQGQAAAAATRTAYEVEIISIDDEDTDHVPALLQGNDRSTLDNVPASKGEATGNALSRNNNNNNTQSIIMPTQVGELICQLEDILELEEDPTLRQLPSRVSRIEKVLGSSIEGSILDQLQHMWISIFGDGEK